MIKDLPKSVDFELLTQTLIDLSKEKKSFYTKFEIEKYFDLDKKKQKFPDLSNKISFSESLEICKDSLPSKEIWEKHIRGGEYKNNIIYFEQLLNINNNLSILGFGDKILHYSDIVPFLHGKIKTNYFLCGKTGTGKTTKLLTLYKNIILRETVFNKNDVILLRWKNIIDKDFWKNFTSKRKFKYVFIDDLFNIPFSTDAQGKYCETQFKLFLFDCYDYDDCKFIFTTNIESSNLESEITANIGASVWDRIKGIIKSFEGKSLRN